MAEDRNPQDFIIHSIILIKQQNNVLVDIHIIIIFHHSADLGLKDHSHAIENTLPLINTSRL